MTRDISWTHLRGSLGL